jgi:hypothetical protein
MPRADIPPIDRSRQSAGRRAALAALLVLGSLGSMLAAQPARADDPAADAGRPARGARMSAIEARYGAPAERYPAVGRPPITRWDYPGFVVYFENDRVIHAVLVNPAG